MDSYEKKYKEMKARVLEIGQGYVKGVDFSKPRQIAEYICPELGESDEKIRQLLVRFVTLHMGDNYSNNISKEECLAWLENQNSNLDNANNEYWRGYREGKQEIIDKYAELEKQAEQNPMNKNRHKFHEGDWIVFNNHHDSIYQVEKIENYEYTLRHFLGGSIHLSFSHEDMIRTWTLKDARDGDVLAEDSCTFIIKKLNQDDIAEIYCCLFDDGDFEVIGSLMFAATSTYPATKKQRDMLFQKMNEAGYEWDADRKEARPLSKSEATSDSVTQTLVDTAKAFLQALSDTPYNNTPIVEAQFAVKQLLTFLSDPKAYNPDASNEHKSAEWSEEDEQLIDEVAVCLRKYEEKVQGGYSKFYVQSLADRIESLRPGNTCKATEWSDDDDAMFQGVIETEQYMLDVVYGRKIFAVGNEDIKEECTKELSWLNSIKDRIK